jgi:uncharacterized membrane protein
MEWKIEEEREVSALYFPFAFVVCKVIPFIVLFCSFLKEKLKSAQLKEQTQWHIQVACSLSFVLKVK